MPSFVLAAAAAITVGVAIASIHVAAHPATSSNRFAVA